MLTSELKGQGVGEGRERERDTPLSPQTRGEGMGGEQLNKYPGLKFHPKIYNGIS